MIEETNKKNPESKGFIFNGSSESIKENIKGDISSS